MLSWMQRTYWMRLTLKLCDASWKDQTKQIHTLHASRHQHFRLKMDLQLSYEPMDFSRVLNMVLLDAGSASYRTDQICSHVASLKSSSFQTENQPSSVLSQ
ncbi:uncharacterized protein LOC110763995 [Prunus avium]|uniref:Uncharacterized protein LOC110763995 n=1 Tax=Prunus avium TaxID=42229 RepID=A0A6P5T5Y4_PRUAV|nr:uncharacterized protein LOC110763995 [Prunus avium]